MDVKVVLTLALHCHPELIAKIAVVTRRFRSLTRCECNGDLSTTAADCPRISHIMRKPFAVVLWCALGLLPVFGQQITVNRQNKTIAITADDSVSVDPEVATITVGYQNYAPTKDAAYEENIRVSNEVTKALLNGGVSKSALETESVKLDRAERDEKWTAEEKKARQFQASQSWTIKVTADRAQAVVDIALHAGANVLEALDWNVSDPKALQAKAGAAALAKAKIIAEQMAKGLNAKLGDLVYASNRAPIPLFAGVSFDTAEASVIPAPPPPPPPHLVLYPKKVKSDATVYAVFAIE
jgi:uncharacterized protein